MGWYVHHLPHWYHAGTVILILVVELVLIWAVFLPRGFRIACFVVVTALQVGIITTANYGFLCFVVLALGVLLLDDKALARVRLPAVPSVRREITGSRRIYRRVEAVILGIAFYTTIVGFIFGGSDSIVALPNRLLEPFRIANAYGLFAVMTPARYEIEFQGSRDGENWIAYPFRYKPQDPNERPGFYGSYQPRFDWNLWFASLEPWRASPWVVLSQERLLEGSSGVLKLFRADPFQGKPPSIVRTVLWQYWFTDLETRRRTGAWWRRQELGPFSGTVMRGKDSNPVFTPP
jgi:hypothetical protein